MNRNELFNYLVNKFYKDIMRGRKSFTIAKARLLAANLVGLSGACNINCFDIVKSLHKKLFSETSSFSAFQYFYFICDELVNYIRSKK